MDLWLPNGDFSAQLDMPPTVDRPSFFEMAYKVGVKLGGSFFQNDYRWAGNSTQNITVKEFTPPAALSGIYLSFTHSRSYIKQGYFDTLNILDGDE